MMFSARETYTAPLCGGCGLTASEPVGAIPFYLPGRDILTTIWRCRECGTYSRDVDLDDPAIQKHFEVASYTDLSAEQRFRAVRSGFFAYLVELLMTRLGRPLTGLRILDFGCAYGHFLERLRDLNAPAEGVEIVRALRETARQRGLTVHAQAPEPGQVTFEIVAAIDSLYYTDDPVVVLRRLRAVLASDGLLIVRVPNRTWLLDALRLLGFEIGRERFGDAKFNFSIAGAVSLLQRAGFDVDEIIWSEKGKADPRPHIRLYYRIAPILCEYLSLKIAPGMLILAHPSPRVEM